MALIKEVRGFTPQIGEDCYLAENATVVGDVIMGNGCSIWFNAVLRGDVNSIRIGNHVNIQDGAVLHTLYQKSTIEIGDYVSVGHNVTIRSKANPELSTSIERLQCVAIPANFGDYEIISEDGSFCTCVIFYMK